MSKLHQAFNFMAADVDYEVQRLNHFTVDIMGLLNSEALTLAVETANIPDTQITASELAHGNTKVKVAGQVAVAQQTLVVKDFILLDIENVVYNWHNQVYSYQTGKIGWAEHYKKNGQLYLFSPDGEIMRSWTVQGLWPSSITWGDFGYDGGEKRTISMTLEVDKAYRNEGISGTVLPLEQLTQAE